jgi:hypothetical protein
MVSTVTASMPIAESLLTGAKPVAADAKVDVSQGRQSERPPIRAVAPLRHARQHLGLEPREQIVGIEGLPERQPQGQGARRGRLLTVASPSGTGVVSTSRRAVCVRAIASGPAPSSASS